MGSELKVLGVDEQIQSALVASQLDFGRNREIHEVLADIQSELQTLVAEERQVSDKLSHRSLRGGSNQFLEDLTSRHAKLLDQTSRLATVVADLSDERSFSSVARVRALQDSIMDRLAVVDALVAKVIALEKSSRNI
jgi:hypothetical protein